MSDPKSHRSLHLRNRVVQVLKSQQNPRQRILSPTTPTRDRPADETTNTHIPLTPLTNRHFPAITPILREINSLSTSTFSPSCQLFDNQESNLTDWELSPSPLPLESGFFPRLSQSSTQMPILKTPQKSILKEGATRPRDTPPEVPAELSKSSTSSSVPVTGAIKKSTQLQGPSPQQLNLPATQYSHKDTSNVVISKHLTTSSTQTTGIQHPASDMPNNTNREDSQLPAPRLPFEIVYNNLPQLSSESESVAHFLYICDNIYEEYFTTDDNSRDHTWIRLVAQKLSYQIFNKIRGTSFDKYSEFRDAIARAVFPEVDLNDAIDGLQNLTIKSKESLREFGKRVEKA